MGGGVGLARFLGEVDIETVEVDRPNRQARRKVGKSDATDAVAAARAALSGAASVTLKTRNGPVEQMRVLLVARRSARTQRIGTLNQLRHLVFTAPEPIRVRYKDRYKTGLVAEAANMKPRKGSDPVIYTTNLVIRNLARRVKAFNTEMKQIDRMIISLLEQTAPSLLALYGVGPDSAASLDSRIPVFDVRKVGGVAKGLIDIPRDCDVFSKCCHVQGSWPKARPDVQALFVTYSYRNSGTNAEKWVHAIAIVGVGISGLGAAWALHRDRDLIVYEARDRLGGHSHTVDVESNGCAVPVDTGFMVYNEVTYPHLTRLLRRLHVPTEASDMSFSFSVEGGIEYGASLRAILAQPMRLFSPCWGQSGRPGLAASDASQPRRCFASSPITG